MNYLKDYISCINVWNENLGMDGIFIGTRNKIIYLPLLETFANNLKISAHQTVIDVNEQTHGVITKILSEESLDENDLLKAIELFRQKLDGFECYNIDELERFKVNASFLSSSIMIKKTGDFRYHVFANKLGKTKHTIKEFYKDLVK